MGFEQQRGLTSKIFPNAPCLADLFTKTPVSRFIHQKKNG